MAAIPILAAVLALLTSPSLASDELSPGIHLPLYRRGGRFSHHEVANLTYLTAVLHDVEERYKHSYRAVDGNSLVRRWENRAAYDENDPGLIDVAGRYGGWYTVLEIGNPKQALEVDVDMLSPDFYTIITKSSNGVMYNASASSSYGFNNHKIHAICIRPSDEFHLPRNFPIRLDIPTCTPSKASRQSLARAGTILGLAPQTESESLSRLSASPLLQTLKSANKIKDSLWSMTLLTADTGILTFGGTMAREVESAKSRGEMELKHFGDPIATKEWVDDQVKRQMGIVMPEDVSWDKHFKWLTVQGAKGWWTGLMGGVWVDGAKVLKNQPILFDITSPFILAPPVAVARFYDSIGGSHRLKPPYSHFYGFPCLNRANIALELAGWSFPVMSGEGSSDDALYGPAGGLFSLGQVGNGTGYCVGRVVETRVGEGEQGMRAGMKNLWVLGEPVFRGLGLVFDSEGERVGVRTY